MLRSETLAAQPTAELSLPAPKPNLFKVVQYPVDLNKRDYTAESLMPDVIRALQDHELIGHEEDLVLSGVKVTDVNGV